ncbi:unnamed protein product [Vitrella brassicaformis CCMP3155]|uniref:NADH:ubiquinone oxidoreductase intermediate-associated protein 30 domain-containing protein n=2 Tax=Vitrella brassicaformis TaxID=1169539 RepID=A0A0G4FWF9_VITBC|nr:unnamed protein product [Vitrella brassicaformis CCMP3155]|eukprot:CEM19552.1 unnamed protein product [Vitrella brassicaformis CCMP3155]
MAPSARAPGLSSSPLADTTMPDDLRRGTVLVVGGTGGVGKRVVERLRKRGMRVRAIVRNKSKGLAFLSGGKEPSLKNDGLEIAAADITKPEEIRPHLFRDVVAVIICSAAIVTPREGDTPDREKYYQGIKFFEPMVVDSPEEVDFRGVQNVVEAAQRFASLDTLKLFSAQPGFHDTWEAWGPLDDVVMGGVSESNIKLEPGAAEPNTGATVAAVFSGEVKTANFGGFVSVRTRKFDPPLDLSAYEGLRLRIKGDGSRYKMQIRDNAGWDSPSWGMGFDTVKDEWVTVDLPFSDFVQNFRNMKTKDPSAKLKTNEIYSLQLMLSKFEFDGELNPSFTPGKFRLVVQSMEAYPDESAKSPRLIQVSSAGVTRPGRPGLDLEKEPPAVRMNDMLGGILTYKLKGEDVVRDSGVTYSVIRPCALTEEPAGAPLQIGQGDEIKGKISREDVADLVVASLLTPAAANKTYEIKCTLPFSEPWQPKADAPRERPLTFWAELLEPTKTGIDGKTQGVVVAAK